MLRLMRFAATIFCFVITAEVNGRDADSQVNQVLDEIDAFWALPPEQKYDSDTNSLVCERIREIRGRLTLIDRNAISKALHDDYDVARAWLQAADSCEFNDIRWPIGPFWGVHRRVGSLGLSTRISSIEQCRAYVNTIRSTSDTVDRTIELMRRLIAKKVTPSRITVQNIPTEITILLGAKFEELQYPFSSAWEMLPTRERDVLWRQFNETEMPRLRASMNKLLQFIESECLPACRSSVGVREVPLGKEFYRYCLRELAETDLEPEQVHALGVAEVRRIWSDLIATIRKTDFYAADQDLRLLDDLQLFAAFRTNILQDPSSRSDDGETVLREYQHVFKMVDHWLPQFFKRLPQLTFGVAPNPSVGRDGGIVAYRQGSLRSGMASVVTVDLSEPRAHLRCFITPLGMHEGVPGHHLQIALAAENEALRPFRRSVWFSAFGEGWALYAERLGYEMELYETPTARIGALASEMHRACRLVVDPGIHWLGWTREQGVEFLKQHTLLSDSSIEDDVTRYIAWPGQAAAYKIGELRIRALRERAEKELGAKFDIRDFHDVVLGAGAVPLNVLERRVNEWIKSTIDQP